MPLTSDLTLDASLFRDDNISPAQRQLNAALCEATRKGPSWKDIDLAELRRKIAVGETDWSARTVLASGRNLAVPSRDAGRAIPCRVFRPPPPSSSSSSSSPPRERPARGTLLHVHGGAFILQTEQDYDAFLARLAAESECVVVAAGYRLAPEDPFPAAPDDCCDVAAWLAGNAEGRLGAPLRAVYGESAGANLALLAVLHLLRLPEQPYAGLEAAVLQYGCYDVGGGPSAALFDGDLVLTGDMLEVMRRAYMPEGKADPGTYRNPAASPLYADLRGLGKMPAILFTVGSLDILLDDSLFMGVRWMAAGGEAVVKVMPGLPHGYATFPPEMLPAAEENFGIVGGFIKEKLM